ncbi:uncharacterized protein RCC_08446 [Ramularia collo-cygni]|uniref:DUF6604 domain-containing protein n=1 Tax=Ramularia collo-cygni TaxID=112498 RepID=A0A2D3VF95_9PEZI|nr:uncharacterized protein RCC_08446 [Ramularia collo-cygni]CZT22741.1 uncharacterized protein RCC_08446 [Ramularia collo-cygni]
MGADFALWCHLQDMHDVREFIKHAWLQYAAGELSITLVSQLSEIGLGLMRLEDGKFTAKYPEFDDWWKLLSYFGLDVYGKGKTLCVVPLDKTSTSEARNEELIELICPAAAVLLRDTRDQMKKLAETAEGRKMLRKDKSRDPPSCGILSPEAYDFSSILKVQAPELLVWIHNYKAKAQRPSKQILERSEWLCGMADYYDAKATPTWLVMACAIHIDLYDIIGDKPGVAAKAWLDTTQRMYHRLDTTCNHFADLEHPSAKWRAELAPIFNRHENWKNQLFVTQETIDFQISRGLDHNTSPDMLGKATSCMMGSPCIAGAALWSDRMAYHKIGIRFANLDLTVFALASLYTAITKSGLLKPTWEDMHFLISTHKSHTPLVPKTSGAYDAESFLKQYLLSLGLPIAQASKYMSAGVPTNKFVMRNHRRALAPTSEYVVAITESWHANDRLGTFERGDLIQTVLMKLTAKSKGLKQGRKGTWHQPQFTVKEVLSTFKSHMIADEPHLNFDYAAFHLLSEKIRRDLHALFPECKNRPLGVALWEIVFHILRDAISGPKEQSLLSKAAVILSDIISAPGVGNKFSKEARNASSGSIPKNLAPNIKPYNPAWTAELWEYFARHHHGVSTLHMLVASSSASHITFYDPDGKKANFYRIAAAAERFWHIWLTGNIRVSEQIETLYHRLEDGRTAAVPMPASFRSLGLRGSEGVGIALLEQLDSPMEMMANGDIGAEAGSR